jgi:hypothetical protein
MLLCQRRYKFLNSREDINSLTAELLEKNGDVNALNLDERPLLAEQDSHTDNESTITDDDCEAFDDESDASVTDDD